MSEITIKDIAKLCGVGVSTVSRAINNHPDINPSTKQLVDDTITKYGYIPNNSARNLKRTDAKCIAILVKGISNPFFTNMISIIEESIEQHKYSLVLRHVEFNEDEVDVALELIKERRLRGILFLGGYFTHSHGKLQKLGVPFILSTVGRIPLDIDLNCFSSFTVDDEKESYRMTKHLIDLGHRNIAILVAEIGDASVGQLRLRGYLRALKEANIKAQNDLICPMKDDIEYYSMKNGYEVTKELLEKNHTVTAIFAISDTLAIGACRAITEAGKQIPGDISVAGYDGIELCEYFSPKLATLKQPSEKIAKESIDLLFDIIAGRQQHKHCIYDGEILIGESTRSLLPL